MKRLFLLMPALIVAAGCASDNSARTSRVHYDEAWFQNQALPQGIPQGEPHEIRAVQGPTGEPIRVDTGVGAPGDQTEVIISEPVVRPTAPAAVEVEVTPLPPPEATQPPTEPTPPPVEVTPPPAEVPAPERL
jgi:hypothetical protein